MLNYTSYIIQALLKKIYYLCYSTPISNVIFSPYLHNIILKYKL
jgi:hypothetical protein